MNKRPEFTAEQIDYICYVIGDWYLMWQERLVNYETKTHSLGIAKEFLKSMFCNEEDQEYKSYLIKYFIEQNEWRFYLIHKTSGFSVRSGLNSFTNRAEALHEAMKLINIMEYKNEKK
jgi:hypothetical protein